MSTFLDLIMATEAKVLRVPALIPESPATQKSVRTGSFVQLPGRTLGAEDLHAKSTGIVLCHHGADAVWVAGLSRRLAANRIGDLNFGISLKNLDPANHTGLLELMEKSLRTSHVFAVVISKSMLQTNWSSLQKIFETLSDLPWAKGRIFTILKENVSVPAFLRVREWIDFRNDQKFEQSVQELLLLLSNDIVRNTSAPSFGAKNTKERIVSNLFPVVELPKIVFSAETSFRTESEITKVCGGPGPVPFLLRNGRIYTFQPVTPNSPLGPALTNGAEPVRENFMKWLSNAERAEWAIALLNSLFRYHAWTRGLRYDEGRNLYFFTRSKPKNVWWQIGQQPVQQEVTAPHIKWIQLDHQLKVEAQYGWRHLGIRADFIQVLGAVFLRLEPSWHLTELDGKTSATIQPVGPVDMHANGQDRNQQALRSLRFWSVVLAKGHQELRINTGSTPMRARVTPLSGFSPSALQNDQMDYDKLMLADLPNDFSIPDLGPIDQRS